jgi:RsiW-degrading membrane proteinase PrsW (M82 family)
MIKYTMGKDKVIKIMSSSLYLILGILISMIQFINYFIYKITAQNPNSPSILVLALIEFIISVMVLCIMAKIVATIDRIIKKCPTKDINEH